MTQESEYSIRLTPLALEMLSEIKDKRHLQKLRERIDKLKFNPQQQGKALTDNLKGYRSVRAETTGLLINCSDLKLILRIS